MSSFPRAASRGDGFPAHLESPSSNLLRREALLTWGLSFYAVTTLVSMAAMSVGAGVLIALALIALGPRRLASAVVGQARDPVARRFFLLSGALAAACLLSLVVADVAPVEYAGQAPEVSYGRDMAKAWYLFWPLLLSPFLMAQGVRERSVVLRSWVIAFGVLSLVGVQQFFTGWPRPQPIPGNEPYFHATLFLGHHLSVASVFLFPFFACLGLAMETNSERRWGVPRWVAWACVALGAACLLLTFSRNLWGALPIGVALFILLRAPRRFRAPILAALAMGAVLSAFVPAIRARALGTMGIDTRVELWRANWEFLSRRPLTGVGWHHNLELSAAYFREKFPERADYFVGHAHNNALEALGSIGLIGFVAWAGWNLWVMARAWKLRSSSLACGLFCAFVVLQLNGLTQVNFWESKVLHQIMWATAWLLAGIL